MRRALGMIASRLDGEIGDHVAELDRLDMRIDELLEMLFEKAARRRDIVSRAWRLTARIEAREGGGSC